MPSAPSKKNYESITGIAAGQMKSVVDLIRAGTKVSIVYNPAALSGDSVHVLKHLLAVIGKISAIECGAIPAAPFTNALGAMDMGILPDFYPGGVSLADTEKIRQVWGENAPLVKGLSALEMIDKAAQGELKALLVYRCNPVVDFPGGKKIEDALRKLDLLVVHDMMSTETSRLANIILPSNGPGYDGGTTTNVGGRVQYRKRGLNTKNPPDWKIVSKMISVLNEEPAEYSTSFGVTDELAGKVTGYGDISKKSIKKEGKNREQVAYTNGLVAQAEKPSAGKKGTLKLRISTCLFANDKILEEPCILAHQFKPPVVHLHETDAANLGLAEGNEAVLAANGTEVRAIVEVSNRCNPGAMVVPRVSDEQGVLGLAGSGPVNWVEVRKG
jgi:predicted molibdopterin-dependent oxidoreductase YjgC